MSERGKRGIARRLKQQQRGVKKLSSRMVSGGLKSAYKPLTDTEVLNIHRASLDILSTVGMASVTPKLQTLALEKGCFLNSDDRLCFPVALVEDILCNAATKFTVHARDPAFNFEATGNTLNLCTGGAAVSMFDRQSQSYRPSVLTDLYDLARTVDTLANLQWFARPVVATDIEDNFELDANTIFASAAGTKKHIATSIVKGGHLPKLALMLDQLAGGESQFKKQPFCTVHATTVVSPLTFATDSLDVVCDAVEIGMPIHSQTGPQAGPTAPAALAGTLVQCCAEGLASLCLINLLQPGYPVIIGNWAFVSDLRTGAFSGGSGEQALLGAASGQMSAFYGIPGGMGAGMTDSKLADNQAGYEKALTMLLASLSGGGFVFESAGMLASLLGCSLEAMVIDDEMLSSIRRIAKGIEVTEETLSVDVIKKTAVGTGHYLGAEQTLSLMESEYIYPELADRTSAKDWQKEGSVSMWDKASKQVDRILDTHKPYYVDTKADRIIRNAYPIQLAGFPS